MLIKMLIFQTHFLFQLISLATEVSLGKESSCLLPCAISRKAGSHSSYTGYSSLDVIFSEKSFHGPIIKPSEVVQSPPIPVSLNSPRPSKKVLKLSSRNIKPRFLITQ